MAGWQPLILACKFSQPCIMHFYQRKTALMPFWSMQLRDSDAVIQASCVGPRPSQVLSAPAAMRCKKS